MPVPPFAAVSARRDDVVALRRASTAGRVVAQGRRAAATTAAASGSLDDAEQARSTVDELLDAGTPLIVEQRVPLRRELAALVARSPFGQVAVWPVVETVQERRHLRRGDRPRARPRPRSAPMEASELALRIAAALGVVGVLAVELFETDGRACVVNELAMRPHNSGHWTIEGSVTSQFEQHLRAVLDYPLGATTPTAPVDRDGQRARRRPDARDAASTSACTTLRALPRRARCTCTARRSGPAARSGT